ncbi:MAG TPA: 3-oxoacyl-[acyl-carrier-protein] synthase III C-terminal domain-containing protein [Myxococcales bacterium]
MSLPAVLGLASAFPGKAFTQEFVLSELSRLWAGRSVDWGRLDRFHKATKVKRRYFALPLSRRRAMASFADRNRNWQEEASALAERALVEALSRAKVSPQDLDHLFLTTSTGVALPGIDARVANRLKLNLGITRWPLTGFGCLGGGAAFVRAARILGGERGGLAAVVAVELFSSTIQLEDLSDANLIATGLFGDGAAAAVLGAVEWRSGPRIAATRSVLIPDTEWAMGWDVRDSGFGVVLSQKVPKLVEENLPGAIHSLLASQGLYRDDVKHWVVHPGGPKILELLQEKLKLKPEALKHSWKSLEEAGNLSSASVLDVFGRLMEAKEAKMGDIGMLIAMGPGFGVEMALLKF